MAPIARHVAAGDRAWLWPVVMAALLATGGIGFILLTRAPAAPEASAETPKAPLVRAIQPTTRTGALPVVGYGTVRARRTLELSAEVSGSVERLADSLVSGGRFRQGTVLIGLDARRYRAAVEQTEADLASARAQMAFLERQIQRNQDLSEGGFAAEERLDELRTERDRTEANMRRLEAVRQSQRVDLERTELVAPFDGVVVRESTSLGEVVQPGQTLAEIVPIDAYEVVVQLDDADAVLIPGLWSAGGGPDHLRPPAQVHVDYGTRRFAWSGFVHRAERALDPEARTVNLVVRIPEPLTPGRAVDVEADPPRRRDTADRAGQRLADGMGAAAKGPPLLLNMYAEVTIEGRKSDNYALIPRIALREGQTVWRLTNAQTLAIQAVEVLFTREDSVAIINDGPLASAAIVTSALATPAEGMALRLADEQPDLARSAGTTFAP